MGAKPKTRFRDPRPPIVCENASAAPSFKNRGENLETPYRTKQYVRTLPENRNCQKSHHDALRLLMMVVAGRSDRSHGLWLERKAYAVLTAPRTLQKIAAEAWKKDFWQLLGASRIIWEHLGAAGSIWEYLGASGSRSEYLGVSGSIWEQLRVSGSVWEHLGAARSIWECLGASGSS